MTCALCPHPLAPIDSVRMDKLRAVAHLACALRASLPTARKGKLLVLAERRGPWSRVTP